MGQRMVRVNELVKREISMILHSKYMSSSVDITITGVDVSPDLRNAKVYYSVFGEADRKKEVGRFFAAKKREIRRLVGQKVILKYLPHLEFFPDSGNEDAEKLNAMLDDMGLVGEIDPSQIDTDNLK